MLLGVWKTRIRKIRFERKISEILSWDFLRGLSSFWEWLFFCFVSGEEFASSYWFQARKEIKKLLLQSTSKSGKNEINISKNTQTTLSIDHNLLHTKRMIIYTSTYIDHLPHYLFVTFHRSTLSIETNQNFSFLNCIWCKIEHPSIHVLLDWGRYN